MLGEFMDIFESHGLKKTKNRKIIFDALKKLNKPVSCDELYKEVLKNEDINLATIYRNLNAFVELDIMNKIIRQDGIAYYYLINNEHSHYMVCDKCNSQFVLDNCPIDINYLNVINQNGFRATGHILEIHGICSDCQLKIIDDENEVGD